MALASLVFISASSAGAPDGRTISASKILGQIAAGEPVEYEGYTIEGALDLDKLTNLAPAKEDLFYQEDHTNLSGDKKAIASRIRIANCTIKGWVNFNNTKFVKPVNFSNTQFQSHAGFRGAVFEEGADLSDAQFFRYADFLGATFRKYAFFNESQFFDCAKFDSGYIDIIGADFRNAEFNGNAYFYGAIFNCDVHFWDVAFSGMADFRYAEFNGNAYFFGARFNDNAYFWDEMFSGRASFSGAMFNSTADFSSREFNVADFTFVKFNGDTIFRYASLNITYFDEAQFDKEAHFEESSFIGGTSFENARFKEDALFDDAAFEGGLTLTRARYSKLFIRWSSIRGGLAYDDAAYMSLMKNFKDIGYYEDYDSCYYAYRQAHRGVDWPSVPDWEEAIRKLIDRPLEWFYGYGTKPFYAFFWSLGIVMAFFLYWWWAGLGGPRDKTRESLKDGEEWLDGDLTDILGYSVTVFLSGTKFFIDPPALPRIEGRSRSWIRKAFILERALGMLFSVLFFIAISGTIVRAA